MNSLISKPSNAQKIDEELATITRASLRKRSTDESKVEHVVGVIAKHLNAE